MKSNLKKLRLDAGLTLQQLAEKSGVAKSRLHDLEKDGSNPTIRTAVKVADALNTSLFYVWKND